MTASPELLEPALPRCAPEEEADSLVGEKAETEATSPEQPGPAWYESLLGSGTLSVFDQAVVSGTSFVTNLALIRLLRTEEYGLYALAWTLTFLFRGVQEQLISAPFMVYAPQKDVASREEYQGSVLAHQVIFALLASGLTLAGLALAWCLAAAGVVALPTGAELAFSVLAAVLPLVLLREFVRQFAFARLDVKSALAIDIVASVLQLALLAGIYLARGAAVTTGLYAIGAASGLAAALWLVAKHERFRFDVGAILRDWQENWTFSRWTLATQLLACTMPYLLPWILAFGSGGAATSAVLAACTTLVGIANMFVIGVSNYLSHRAIHAFHEEGVPGLVAVLRRTALLFTVTIGLFALAAWFGGQPAADFLFKGKYPDAGPVIGWLALSTLVSSLNVTAGNGLWALERPHANFAADVVSFVATLAAALAFVPTWGASGAAAASCVGMTLALLVRGWTLHTSLVEVAAEGGDAP